MTSIIPTPKVSCILQIKIVVSPENRETGLVLFKECFDHVVSEPQCAYFILGEEGPGVFRWTEAWTKDKEWIINVLFQNLNSQGTGPDEETLLRAVSQSHRTTGDWKRE